MDIIHAAEMDEAYGTYHDDTCFSIHRNDADTDCDTDDDIGDDTEDDTDDDTVADADGSRRGNKNTIKVPGYFFLGAWSLRSLWSLWSLFLGPWSSVLGPWYFVDCLLIRD